ncbi:MAG: hypothetical protein BWX80_03020 [Candidatus Hydrogenedentes bacterium ADurb.Bin101]|nr:MAG: hypothetical protein BWX80_03020 [Candidatus Hydrogenedentes bacterium ADurb.Bin101]
MVLAAQQPDHLRVQPADVNIHVPQHFGRFPLPFFDQAEQNMLGADVIVVEVARLFNGQFQHFFGARRKGNFAPGHGGRFRLHMFLNFSD